MPDHHAIFVTSGDAIQPEGGGVQRCTREYLALAAAAGFSVEVLAYPYDRHPLTRLRRKLFPRPYRDLVPEGFAARVAERAQAAGAAWIFLNQVEPGLLAPLLRPLLAPHGVRLALLSHGADSSDYLHDARIRAGMTPGGSLSRHDATWLGRQLFAEADMHRAVDVVFCLSETDREHARWLGGRRVHMIPRAIADEPLAWTPTAGRIGTVSTLVHAPNVEGIVSLADALAAAGAGLRLRVVGGPADAGRALAARYPAIEYLGPLSDAAFAAEAATWCVFANPIFSHARGCSTKLAVPLSWHLPVATTRSGARGYVWDETLVALHDTPESLAADCVRLAQPAAATEARRAVELLAARSPRLHDLAPAFRAALTDR